MCDYRFVSYFEVGENDPYAMYCFIECGHHTLLIIWHVFDYFFVKTKFSGCEWEKYEPSIRINISKKLR